METTVGDRGGGKVVGGRLSLQGGESERGTRGGGEDFASCGGLGRPGRAGGREEGGERGEWREGGGLEVAEEASGGSRAPTAIRAALAALETTRAEGSLGEQLPVLSRTKLHFHFPFLLESDDARPLQCILGTAVLLL